MKMTKELLKAAPAVRWIDYESFDGETCSTSVEGRFHLSGTPYRGYKIQERRIKYGIGEPNTVEIEQMWFSSVAKAKAWAKERMTAHWRFFLQEEAK